jgi:hypothetical protein
MNFAFIADLCVFALRILSRKDAKDRKDAKRNSDAQY